MYDDAEPPARYYEPDPEPCPECGADVRDRCEHLLAAQRAEREREADAEAEWWKNVGGPLLGLPDDEERLDGDT